MGRCLRDFPTGQQTGDYGLRANYSLYLYTVHRRGGEGGEGREEIESLSVRSHYVRGCTHTHTHSHTSIRHTVWMQFGWRAGGSAYAALHNRAPCNLQSVAAAGGSCALFCLFFLCLSCSRMFFRRIRAHQNSHLQRNKPSPTSLPASISRTRVQPPQLSHVATARIKSNLLRPNAGPLLG